MQKVGKAFENTGSTCECEILFLEAEAPSEMAVDASCCFTYEHICKAFKYLKDPEWASKWQDYLESLVHPWAAGNS